MKPNRTFRNGQPPNLPPDMPIGPMGPPTIGGAPLGAPMAPPQTPGLQGTIGQDANPPDMPAIPSLPPAARTTQPVGPPMSLPPMGGMQPPGGPVPGGPFPGQGKPPVVFPPRMQGFQRNPAGDEGRGMAARRALMGIIRQG